MIKLSELSNDTMICLDNGDISVMSKEEFINSSYYIDRDTDECPEVYTAKLTTIKFDVEEWVNHLGEDETYEDWVEDMCYSIGEENIKLIEGIMNKASEKNPIYWEDKKIDINN